MKVRVYFSKNDCVDPYTIFFPYPKKMQCTEQGRYYIKGVFLTCAIMSDLWGNIDENNFNMYGWQELDMTLGYSINKLGKRVHGNDVPIAMQKWIAKMEPLWNDAVTKNTPEAWEAWNEA